MSTKNAKTKDRKERAAALLAEQKRRERRRNMVIGSVVGLVVAIIVAGIVFIVVNGSEEVTASEAGRSEYALTVGSADAPDNVVIYEDFLCPFCGQLESAAGEELTQLANDGEVQLEYRPISILGSVSDYSPRSLNAFAVVLDASGPNVAKTYHDLLYANQPSEQGPYPSDDDLVDLAVEAGAEEQAVRPGIEGMAMQSFIDGAAQEADDANVQGTPTILLNGQPFSDGDSFAEIADNLITAIQE